MPKSWRVAAAVAFFIVGFGFCAYGAAFFLRSQPPSLNFAAGHKPGSTVHINIQTVSSIGTGLHPSWVSYLTQAPDGKWVHTTSWEVPAHSRIVLTDYEYDGTTTLRNAVWGRVTGVVGGTELVNGKPHHYVYSADHSSNIAHTFTVPALGINVPWRGLSGHGAEKVECSKAPCPTSDYHYVDRVTFLTGSPHQFHWQCTIPCGGGYLDGNGGPMQTLGYMAGLLKVQPYPGHPLGVGE